MLLIILLRLLPILTLRCPTNVRLPFRMCFLILLLLFLLVLFRPLLQLLLIALVIIPIHLYLILVLLFLLLIFFSSVYLPPPFSVLHLCPRSFLPLPSSFLFRVLAVYVATLVRCADDGPALAL